MCEPSLTVQPVTSETWPDMVRLFESEGSPHYCWCMPYRHPRSQDLDKPGRKAAMEALVATGTPVGVLAYDGAEPVAWASVAPRETFPKLKRSRVMPDVGDEGVWTITCMFVRRDWRDRGVTHALLEDAVEYARESGARVVEAYPWDTAGITATHMGHSSIYEAADFVPDEGRRWVRRL